MDQAAEDALRRLVAEKAIRPFLIGSELACMLFGVYLVLAFLYFSRYRHDRLAFKVLAGIATVLAFLNVANVMAWSDLWAVKGYVDPTLVVKMPLTFAFYSGLCNSTLAFVQLFFAWRLWVVSMRNHLLAGFVVAIILSSLGPGLYLLYIAATKPLFVDWANKGDLTVAYLSLILGADVIITVGIVYFLVFKPRKDGQGLIPRNRRFQAMALHAVQANILSAAVHVTIIALTLHDPMGASYTYTGLSVQLTYLCSLLLALLGRPTPSARSSSGLPTTTSSTFHHTGLGTLINLGIVSPDPSARRPSDQTHVNTRSGGGRSRGSRSTGGGGGGAGEGAGRRDVALLSFFRGGGEGEYDIEEVVDPRAHSAGGSAVEVGRGEGKEGEGEGEGEGEKAATEGLQLQLPVLGMEREVAEKRAEELV
ncbi:hypothetical protein JCM8097_006280 [Rhodosporidiobolus ruineniae]